MYNVDYNDDRFKNVLNEQAQKEAEVKNTYDNMINESDAKYQNLINQVNENAEKRAGIQQQQTDLALETIENEKKKAEQDYTKEQKASYADYMKESNRFGANAEQMASLGLTGTGYSETSQVAMYNQYQNRVATAKSSLNDTMTQYTLAAKDAILQNSSALLQIYADAAQQEAAYTLEAFQYKNGLITDRLNQLQNVSNTYYNRYQDVLNQINTENSLAEQVRQYNETMAYNREQAAQSQANWEKEYALSLKNANNTSKQLKLQEQQLQEEKETTLKSTTSPLLSSNKANTWWDNTYSKYIKTGITETQLAKVLEEGLSSNKITEKDKKKILNSFK